MIRNLSFRSRFFLCVLISVISGLLVYFLMGLFELPFRNAAVISVTSVVMSILLKRMQNQENAAA